MSAAAGKASPQLGSAGPTLGQDEAATPMNTWLAMSAMGPVSLTATAIIAWTEWRPTMPEIEIKAGQVWAATARLVRE